MLKTNIKMSTLTWLRKAPPSGALGLFSFVLSFFSAASSLLAGHVGNIDGSTGKGVSYEKYVSVPQNNENM